MPEQLWQIILAGTGGQGLILAGSILAKAAVREGKNVVQSQSYGTQSRGGYSQSEVQVSSDKIYFPKCEEPDLVLALSQTAYDRHVHLVSDDCYILFDQDVVRPVSRIHDMGFSFSHSALELGDERTVNFLALGAVLKVCPVVALDTVIHTIKGELAEKVHLLNLKALNYGYTLPEPRITG